jgi:predicted outer membrane repeat protein
MSRRRMDFCSTNRKHHLLLERLEDRRMLAVFTVSNLDDGPVTGPNDLPGSLRQAIYDANANQDADTIEFESGLSGTIFLTNGELSITDPITIEGPGADVLTIDAQSNSRVFYIYDGIVPKNPNTISGLDIKGGLAPAGEFGGGIHSKENLEITGSIVSGNSAERGGGIYSSGNLILTDSQVLENHAADRIGSGIYTQGNTVLSDCVIADNTGGSGIDARSAGVSITRCAITGNIADVVGSGSAGGGVDVRDGSLDVTDSMVANNVANTSGGGIFFSSTNVDADLVLTNSVVSGNHAANDGGGIRAGSAIYADAHLVLTNSVVSANHAANDGGGIYLFQGSNASFSMTSMYSTISGNEADQFGGGIYSARANSTLTASTISDNTAGFIGGGIYNNAGTVSMDASTISANTAGTAGGGIWNSNPVAFGPHEIEISDSTVSGNSAQKGGGIFSQRQPGSYAVSLVLTRATITANTADPGQGSGIYTRNHDTTIGSSIIAGNANSDFDSAGSIISEGHNLIGTGNATTLFNQPGDQTGVVDPILGPLADNGGPTRTHAVLPGSPALDLGDPGFLSPPDFDQRGAPFARVYNGRIDIGSFESQPVVIDGDFNDDGFYDCLDIDALVAEIAAGTNGLAFDITGDGLVDLADRDAWLAEAGEVNLGPGEVYALGDANLDGFVDGLDFIIWNANKFTTLAEWCAGDFNADHFVDGLDFIIWNANKFQNNGAPTSLTRLGASRRTDAIGNFDDDIVAPGFIPRLTHQIEVAFAKSSRGHEDQQQDGFDPSDELLFIY